MMKTTVCNEGDTVIDSAVSSNVQDQVLETGKGC